MLSSNAAMRAYVIPDQGVDQHTFSALSALSLPSVVVSEQLDTLHFDLRHRDLFAPILKSVDGKIDFVSPLASDKFGYVVESVKKENRAHQARWASTVFAHSCDRNLPLLVRIWASPGPAEQITAAITIVDLEHKRQVSAPILRSAFGLTAAEATLASSLAEGFSLSDVARRTGVCISTLRSQLSMVLAKTGTSRQGHLVSLLGKILLIACNDGGII
jgi:DNA-binding CsgD family transcriptional regulator